MNKQILVDAIIGQGIKGYDDAERMVRFGLAEFTGNQWNPDWEFKRKELLNLDDESLHALYSRFEK